MPIDLCLARLVRRDWLIDGPLSGYLTSYIESLKTRRYAQGTIGAYLRCLAHFSFWMTAEGLTIANIDLPLIERFIRHHLPACTCPAPCRSDINEVRAALHHLQTLLPVVNDETASPLTLEIERFNGYLRDICGLAPLTCSYRIQHVKAFLVGRFGNDAPEIGLLVSDDIDAFLNELASTWSPTSRKLICTSLRSYLRFHAMLGDDTRILSAALPTIANWRRRHPPEVLSEVQLEQFLRAFDQTHPVELRDYVIARFLLDLGLRADEVAHLTLDCVDWRNGIVSLCHTKSQRVQQLPLPTQTGEALGRYLRLGRPQTTNRALFSRHRAPFGVALSVDAIRNTMNRAFVRSGLADRFCNTHVLRRSMATRLQKSGVSIKEIADMLRHRDLNTARAYARVDLEHLRAVAIPWPGSKS
ncbi:integrase [Pollutimonas nitritireducens]|uniref:Integrase n=1 Tax=Pollutimonas nitritireducens TaxID=2045209 RepID=A0A2N4UG59_9BURK|nr:tyrosine-type recombinase/integrase [Pollutimonas nitritireducens]PLC53996.1 integrase [Pollutimonas nitritireducens]